MKSLKLYLVLTLVVLALLVAACGGGGGSEPAAPSGGDSGGSEPVTSPVDPATAGTITGRVLFTGVAPEPEAILMDAEPTCQALYPDGAFAETVVVNDNGTLRNVFIYVKAGLGDVQFPTPGEGVVLDQKGCRYIPHVFGMQAGQDLVIRNSDDVLHNIHPVPTVNDSFNVGQPVKDMETTKTFEEPEVMIPIACDVHEWMSGYAGVLSHPYYAVSGEDGSFTLSNVPPGTYTVEAWHEVYGAQTMEVTVSEKGAAEIEFTFTGG
ncbi:MAG: carboxypeptidase regulatory-like domain-containing protein [Chloroflexota bacterium]